MHELDSKFFIELSLPQPLKQDSIHYLLQKKQQQSQTKYVFIDIIKHLDNESQYTHIIPRQKIY